MDTNRLLKDKEFKKVCMCMDSSGENYDEIHKEFVKAFLKWHEKLENYNKQLQKIEKRKIELTIAEYNDLRSSIIAQKNKISDSYVEKFCAVIEYVSPNIKGIDKVVAQILKDCIAKHNRKVENWIVNTVWVTNKRVMTTIIEEKGKVIEIIPESLANDSEFMLYFVYMYADTKSQWVVYRKIGDKLKYNNKFVIDFLKTFVLKYKNTKNFLGLKQDFFLIIKTVYDNKRIAENIFIYENYDFWNAVKDLKLDEEIDNKTLQGLVKKFTQYYDSDEKNEQEEQKTLKERIEYLIQNPDKISKYQSDDYVLMIKLIKINPNLYVYASDRLKSKNSFIEDAIRNGVEKSVAEREKTKILLQREMKKNDTIEAQKQERRKENERQYGIGSRNYQLVEDYFNTYDSIEDYCLKRNFKRSDFEKILDSVCKINSEVAERREQRKEFIQNEMKEKAQVIIDKIMQDELYIYQFAKENTSLVKITDIVKYAIDKKQMIEKFLNVIISQKLTVNDYIRLFSFDYKSTMKKIYRFIKSVEQNFPEWEGRNNYLNLTRKEISELIKYEIEYRDCDFLGNKRGVEINGEMKLVDLTETRLEEVFKYLQDRDEYICQYTVNEAIKVLIKEWIS